MIFTTSYNLQLLALNGEIAICTETWLSSCDTIEGFSVNGYDCFRVDRVSDSGHEGVALWIKSNIRPGKSHPSLLTFSRVVLFKYFLSTCSPAIEKSEKLADLIRLRSQGKED